MKRGPRPKGWHRAKPPGWLAPVVGKLDVGLFRPNVTKEDRPAKVREKVVIEDPVPADAAAWTGCVVSHWVVGDETDHHPAKMPRPVYVCVSKCGVVSKFSAGDLARGATQTCYGCRPGEHPPPACRVLPESELADLQQFWRFAVAITFEFVRGNSGGKDAGMEFDQYARPLISALVGASSFGKEFGWKCWVLGSRKKPGRKATSGITFLESPVNGNGNGKAVNLSIHPAGCAFSYDVQLGTGRSDVTQAQVEKELKRAGEPWTLQNGTPAAAATPGPLDLDKLKNLRSNLDTLLQVGADVNELANLKAAAKEKVAAAREAERAANLALLEAEEAAKVAKDSRMVMQEKVDDHDRRLRNAVTERNAAQVREVTAVKREADAKAVYEPASFALKTAVAELQELEALEADQLKRVGDAAGMKALLAALAGITG